MADDKSGGVKFEEAAHVLAHQPSFARAKIQRRQSFAPSIRNLNSKSGALPKLKSVDVTPIVPAEKDLELVVEVDHSIPEEEQARVEQRARQQVETFVEKRNEVITNNKKLSDPKLAFETLPGGIGVQDDCFSFKLDIRRGCPRPLGVTILQYEGESGVNFSVYAPDDKSRKKNSLRLNFYMTLEDKEPFVSFTMHPDNHCTDGIWHCLVLHLPRYFAYGYVVNDEDFVNADPYSHLISARKVWGKVDPDEWTRKRCVVNQEPRGYDWEGDKNLFTPIHDLVIYEMHVRGYTQDPSSEVEHPGTYLGLVEKIDYLIDLGVNAVELLPVFEFDECSCDTVNPVMGNRNYNYWGYSTESFFTPMVRYSVPDPTRAGASVVQFKDMVKALHKKGIEVILDVVFNHTGGFSFQNLAKEVFYITSEGYHTNYSGCGNTLNCNHPMVIDFVVDCLVFWVQNFHVDGFRFDEAPILGRGADGTPFDMAPLLVAISNEPALKNIKLIAEAWDAGGLYQIGKFAHQHNWCEWNGRYRDNVRDVIKGTSAYAMREFGTRLAGSPDIYGSLKPSNSINFITCHDGFCLMDLVSYNEKHNIANGEDNRDGHNDNQSWNCGVEGLTKDQGILRLRQRQVRNFFMALLIARGVPMIHMGDEYGHSKMGNNNTWNQDNTLNWFNWEKRNSQQGNGLFYFVKNMIAFRKAHSIFTSNSFVTDEDIEWHGSRPWTPDWDNESNRLVAFALKYNDKETGPQQIFIAFNTSYLDFDIELPEIQDKVWRHVVDTYREAPDDYIGEDVAPEIKADEFNAPRITMHSYSCCMLVTRSP